MRGVNGQSASFSRMSAREQCVSEHSAGQGWTGAVIGPRKRQTYEGGIASAENMTALSARGRAHFLAQSSVAGI